MSTVFGVLCDRNKKEIYQLKGTFVEFFSFYKHKWVHEW